jgi:Peptidase family S41
MRIIFLLITVFMLSLTAIGQKCSCTDEFSFVKTFIERNHGGFNANIKTPEEPAYKAFVTTLTEGMKKEKNDARCHYYLVKYMNYLQDHHSGISLGGIAVREDSFAAVQAFMKSAAYLQTEKIVGDSTSVINYLSSGKQDSLEGIYTTNDGIYTVALLKNKNRQRDYAALILNSRTILWSKGQVKFELKKVNDSLYDGFFAYRNHTINYEEVSLKNGALQLTGWRKTFPYTGAGGKTLQLPPIDNELIRFTLLDSLTSMVSIRSFDARQGKKLDSVYKLIIPEIRKRPNLVIDVRNNGGGSDANYKALMPFIYTDTVYGDITDIYNTPDNISAYQKYDSLVKQSNPGSNGIFAFAIFRMKKATPNTFIPQGNGKPSKAVYRGDAGAVKKVAILYNRNCASSCEGLLLEAIFSSKTITVGENSGGDIGYGDVMSTTTPCGNTLRWTTTVHQSQKQYEFVGIPPQFRVPATEMNWVDYARRLLQRQ